MKPNNVTRLLDSRRIPYTAFELPAEKLGALEAASFLKVPPGRVYKTIVITREGKGKPILAVVPGPGVVDLKVLARAIRAKKVSLPTEAEAERLTGLQAGGISPLALLQRGFQVVLDASARQHAEIYISGGQRGLNIRLPVQALIDLTGATVAEIASAPSPP
jgi:Cys-tRNA(Pro)/Cys-tRNA(Cys) deacylase